MVTFAHPFGYLDKQRACSVFDLYPRYGVILHFANDNNALITGLSGPEGEVYREIIRENSTARAVVDEFAPATWSEPIT